ncbi:hypothetical protein [Mycobacterium spongiae]|uniref:hypothetical protein n=1 Tax=Mycobacterium spongiae TaxID=886343 RepID=UPI001FE7D8A6|nr:hypothetical protein [Mycobacterium spongiae]
MPSISTLFTKFYGSRPSHLLAMISGFALVGYLLTIFPPSALWNEVTWWQSIAVWFVAAVVAHDLLLYPVYALADRILATRVRRQDDPAAGRTTAVPVRNYIRMPAMAAGLTLLVFLPGIIRQGAPTYLAATGQTQQPFLGRWLLLTAVLFGISALAYTVRLGIARRRGKVVFSAGIDEQGCSAPGVSDEE